MTGETSSQVIARLGAEIDRVLIPLVPDDPFALLDFPDHSNVGDSAIWLGEMEFFKKLGRAPAYVSPTRNVDYPRLAAAIGPKGTIFIHGGGNFGDIWPQHQALREAVLRDLKDHRVVQLPQTLQYNDPASIARTAELIRAHGNFVLLVRDERSLELAKSNFPCEVQLCPDMAFCLGRLTRGQVAAPGILALLRTDKETSGVASQSAGKLPELVIADWLDEPEGTRRQEKLATMILGCMDLSIFSADRRRSRYYLRLGRNRVDRGVRLLSSRQYVISDRLHAHILCTLLDIPHTALDNNYGKISGFMSAWSTDWSGVRKAGSFQEALDQLTQ
jgi:pyruvyl transferase EpsO